MIGRRFSEASSAARCAPTPWAPPSAARSLVDRLIDSLGTNPAATRTIVFTDSRDDAAATAAGLEMNHFRDLLRQLIRVEARARPDPVALVRDAAADRDIAEEHRPLLAQLKAAHPDIWAAYRLDARGVAADDDLVTDRRI